EPLQRALNAENYQKPTPIQAQSIPHLLEGRDLLGIAQTGTGKTAAFALPILQRLTQQKVTPGPRLARALVLTPTRELALQIHESFRAYGRHLALSQAVIFGGVGQGPQVTALKRGVDIIVATPGRLLDLMGQGHVKLDRLSVFVLDEADRMLDMGFIHDVKKIIQALPPHRQSLFFSATMPAEAARLADKILTKPVRVEVTPVSSTVERIDQRVFFIDTAGKRVLLAELLKDPAITRALVFTRTKHGANRVAEQLAHANVRADAIHGNKSQSARQRALEDFRSGRVRVLVATDIAARGIDIDDISHVINYELPNVPETYVHRIGRTARAGATGVAFSFCDASERAFLRDIEKMTRRRLDVVAEHPLAGRAAPTEINPPRRPEARVAKGRPAAAPQNAARPLRKARMGWR
ncbi:MAG TPA: DEAD/DEAH box helicase, partial [Stellaceae bacterium]|nr:DEAD/DEAH box helicase [Stellaceae bacterium]